MVQKAQEVDKKIGRIHKLDGRHHYKVIHGEKEFEQESTLGPEEFLRLTEALVNNLETLYEDCTEVWELIGTLWYPVCNVQDDEYPHLTVPPRRKSDTKLPTYKAEMSRLGKDALDAYVGWQRQFNQCERRLRNVETDCEEALALKAVKRKQAEKMRIIERGINAMYSDDVGAVYEELFRLKVQSRQTIESISRQLNFAQSTCGRYMRSLKEQLGVYLEQELSVQERTKLFHNTDH